MSNRRPGEDENLLKSVAATVEVMRDRLDKVATKDEVELLVGKLVTKEEFDPVREQVGFLGGQVEYIRDRMATKDDLAEVEARLSSRVDGLETKVDRLDVTTNDGRGDVEQVQLRLDGIEKAVTSRIGSVEAEVSRMRSVLYLLVKDRPDMLPLLGQAPPAGG